MRRAIARRTLRLDLPRPGQVPAEDDAEDGGHAEQHPGPRLIEPLEETVPLGVARMMPDAQHVAGPGHHRVDARLDAVEEHHVA